MKLTHCLFVAASFVVSPSIVHAAIYDWDGSGTSDASGLWSFGANWGPTDAPVGGPVSGDTANLNNVTTGTRTVTYDSGTTGTVSFLNFTQSSAGAINQLLINKNLSVLNPITLGASAGTALITVGSSSTAGFSLVPSGAINLNTGGEIALTATGNGGTGYNFGAITNNQTVTIAGGTLRISPTTGTSTGTSAESSLTGNLTMTSGSLVIDNATGVTDRRLSISGNLNITGGAISSSRVGLGGTLGLNGATNTLKPASFDTDIGITLGSGAAQSLDSTGILGAITLRGTGVKTIINTGTVGQILMIDGTNGVIGSATTLRLGSNITLSTGAAQLAAATFSQSAEATTNITNFGIDTNVFTLDLSTGGSSGVWTPNVGVAGNVPTWTLSGSGTIKANAFNFNTATVTTNVGSGVTLQAVGTNSTATDLSGTGTINAGSTFLYSGNAATGTPATLTSNRNIGNLNVSSGALRINSNMIAAGLVTVGSNATLNLSANTLSATGLTFNNGLLTNPANLTVIGAGANVLKTGASTLVLSNANNSYTGTTTLQDGILQFTGNVPLSANSALGNATSAIIMGTSSSTTAQRIILSTTTASTVGRAIDATSGTSVATDAGNSNRYRISQDNSTGATLTLDGTLSWGSTGGLAITRGLEITALKSASSVVVNGIVSSVAGAGGLLINGGNSGLGSVALTNANNSFSQAITVTNGSLLVGGNAPLSGNNVLGTNTGAIILGDGGTGASNWTTTGSNELLYGQNSNPAMLIAGTFTVARGVSLGNAATFVGGNPTTVTGNGVANSYVLGGSTANASVLSGAVTVAATAADKLLNLTQAAGGTFTVNGNIGANPDATGKLNVVINAQNGLSSGSTPANYAFSSNSGTVILSGANNYDGTTTVSKGTLLINGANSTALGAVSVSSNSTLGGIGTVGGTVTVDAGAFVAPGVAAGNLTLNNGLDLNGTYTWDLAALSTANPGTNFDILTVTSGTVDIAGAALGLNLGANSPSDIPFWQINQTWSGILNNTGAGLTNGNFNAIDNTAWASFGNFTTSYTGNDVNLIWNAVPEPDTFSLIGGLGVLALLRRRR